MHLQILPRQQVVMGVLEQVRLVEYVLLHNTVLVVPAVAPAVATNHRTVVIQVQPERPVHHVHGNAMVGIMKQPAEVAVL